MAENRSVEDDRMWLIYFAGVAHGALMRIRDDLVNRNYERSMRNVQDTLDLFERAFRSDGQQSKK